MGVPRRKEQLPQLPDFETPLSALTAGDLYALYRQAVRDELAHAVAPARPRLPQWATVEQLADFTGRTANAVRQSIWRAPAVRALGKRLGGKALRYPARATLAALGYQLEDDDGEG